MGTSTLLALRNEAKFRVARDGDPDLDTRLTTRINWTIARIATALTLPELEGYIERPVFASSFTISPPSDLLYLKVLKVKEDRSELKPYSVSEFISADEVTEGAPRRYFFYGSSVIKLIPVPSAAWVGTGKIIGIYYAISPSPITNDSDFSPLANYCDEGIVAGAAAQYFRDKREPERAKEAIGDVVAWLRSLNNPRGRALQFSGGRTLSTAAAFLTGD